MLGKQSILLKTLNSRYIQKQKEHDRQTLKKRNSKEINSLIVVFLKNLYKRVYRKVCQTNQRDFKRPPQLNGVWGVPGKK
jgi:hypothetical protein